MDDLLGRRDECAALDRVVADVLAGSSRVLILRGEAGVGKSALLAYLSGQVTGWQVASAVGVESEMELAYSGLHQLCAPLLDHLGELPVPQRDALAIVFGLSAGPAPDRFLVGLAALTLVAQAAEQQPLACIIDDAQWLDGASAQLLGFVARRLLAERVALVGAARTGIGDGVLAGLPALEIGGLSDGDARPLLLGHMPGPIDAAVTDRIIAESRGNPLALLELPRTWQAADLAGGFGLPVGQPVAGKIEHSYVQRLRLLPADTQLLVLTAAAEPLGDPELLRRAAHALGIDMTAAAPAVDAGLVQVRIRVEFAHPLVRSAAYRAAEAADRRRVHRALADATDALTDPDRRAWHRARATSGPDEEVAAELERSAGRAQARAGLAAAAAFLTRATELTPLPEARTRRALAAASASVQAGGFGRALGLLAAAEAGPLDELQSARADLLRGRIAFALRSSDAPLLLLKAAKRLEPLDLDVARETYLDAWHAALYGGSGDLREVSRAARALPPPVHPPRPVDLLLEGLALLVTDGLDAAAPVLRQAMSAFTDADIPMGELLRWGWMAQQAATALWDDHGWREILLRQVRLVRDAGALEQLPILLAQMAFDAAWSGDFAAAASLIAEDEAACEATGSRIARYPAQQLASLRGREAEATPLIQSSIEDDTAAGDLLAVRWAHWVAAVLYNGLGRYADALAAAGHATEHMHPYVSPWALPELIEAATRTGNARLATAGLERLTDVTLAGGTDFGLGIQARSRALLSQGEVAEGLYREAIGRLGRTKLRPELARAHLLYGEWLRRENRRADAREQLRAAHDMLAAMGMEAFAERARRELIATGEKVLKRSAQTRDRLTPQEALIARLARDGQSNQEIGAQLFISTHTVEWHLRKVFTKLDISSRRQLQRALTDQNRPVATSS